MECNLQVSIKSKQINMINLLMIDDNKEICQALRAVCLSEDKYNLDYRLNLADGIAEFKERTTYYDAIILDGRGHHSREDTKERDNHVIKGIQQIRKINSYTPIFIYTGYLDIVKEQLYGIVEEEVPIFTKTKQGEIDLFKAIDDIVANNIVYKLNRKYKDLLDVFEKGFLDKDNKDIYEGFLDILTQLEEDQLEDLPKNHLSGILNKFRMIQEHIYSKLSEYYPSVLPEDAENFSHKKYYLTGGKSPESDYKATRRIYQEQPIEYLSQVVNWNPGTYNHYIKDSTGFYTKYGIKALAYSLFEVMMWYKNGIETGLFDK